MFFVFLLSFHVIWNAESCAAFARPFLTTFTSKKEKDSITFFLEVTSEENYNVYNPSGSPLGKQRHKYSSLITDIVFKN